MPALPPPRPYAALPLGWAALLLYLTLAPADKLPPQPVWELLSFDTFAHAAFFAVQAALAWFSLRRQRRWPALARHAGWAVLLGCTAFGALIEALQMALPFNRHGEWSDLLSDSIGTALALGLAYLGRPALRRQGWALSLAMMALAGRPARAQDLARARHTIETLASEKLHGRGYVQQGEHLAAAYLRGRFRDLKLTPLAPDYTQSFALDVNTFPGAISIKTAGLETHGQDVGTVLIAAPNSGPATTGRPLRLASLTDRIFTDSVARSCWLQGDLSGSALVFGPAQTAQLAQLPPAGPLRQHLQTAGAWITIKEKLTASLADSQAPQPRLEVLRSRVPASWLAADTAAPCPAAGRRPMPVLVTLALDARLQRNYPTQNLAAVIRGTAQPDSFLVVSAHYDHLGTMGKSVYFPGANDNASGVAMLLELAAHYARPENRPACSVVFLLFGAEEAGLVGSQYFVAHPLVPLQRIKFLVNLDLLGTGEQGATVVNGRVFEAAYQRLSALNEAHHYLPALGARGKAANSDHYPFSEAGVPAFFIYTRGGSAAYHDVNDQPAALSLAGFAGAFGLVRDFLNGEGAAPAQKNSR